MLDDTRDASDLCCSLRRIGNCAARTVEEVVAFVGYIYGAIGMMTELRVEAKRLQLSRNDWQGHLDDFDRQRKTAKLIGQLAGICDDDELPRRTFDDLLAKQCAAATFDQGKAWAYLVGTIDGKIEERRLIEVGDGEWRATQRVAGWRSRLRCHVRATPA